MTTKEKQGFGLYFLLAFGLAWLCQVGGCMVLLQKQNAVLYQLALVATMLCPLLAVLLVQKVFLRQPTGIGWKVQGKRRYWLAAWFGPAVFTVLAAVLYFAVFPHRLDLSGSWLAAAYGGEMDAQTLRRELGVSNLSYMLETGLFAVTLAPVINMFAALGEEVGWRGYMMPHLKEQLGLLNGRLLGGVIWGVWHWPLMLLVGYEYLGAVHCARRVQCGGSTVCGSDEPGRQLLQCIGSGTHWPDRNAAHAGCCSLADPAKILKT